MIVVSSSLPYYPPRIERDMKTWAYVGSLQTVCKGIQNADAVCITEKSELVLEREPRNGKDPFAIKVMVKCSKILAEEESDSDKSYTSSESSDSSPEVESKKETKKEEKKEILRLKHCGYLPAKLVPFLAPILDQFVLKKKVCVAVDCILRGREKGGLSSINNKLTWFDVQIDIFLDQSKDDDQDAETAICELLIKQESNPEILI